MSTYQAPAPYNDDPRRPIALQPVESSQAKAIGYDESTSTLAVQFKHGAGAIYHYLDVSKETFDAFLSAKSAGKFFGENIKQLPFKKFVNDQPPAPPVDEEAEAA